MDIEIGRQWPLWKLPGVSCEAPDRVQDARESAKGGLAKQRTRVVLSLAWEKNEVAHQAKADCRSRHGLVAVSYWLNCEVDMGITYSHTYSQSSIFSLAF